ncbi:MAG: hypothetical protein Harvfovirus1_21 [Harvfovirus sp.]|uniref:Uncharacterized protein n=1 Tax=Harvfovirus sp. TaxID=2487768 RepID=A0A3G4ZZK0_9VIRU|nr:MAG: hypothetical protein Harvfovirus1_21 [Harvfovirus sp.]
MIQIIVVVLVMFVLYKYYRSVNIDNNSVGESYDIFTDVFLPLKTDITGANYNDDFSLTLEQAQQQKYDKILEFFNFQPGMLFWILDAVGGIWWKRLIGVVGRELG